MKTQGKVHEDLTKSLEEAKQQRDHGRKAKNKRR